MSDGYVCERCSYESAGREHAEGILREISDALAARGLGWLASSKVGFPGQLLPVDEVRAHNDRVVREFEEIFDRHLKPTTSRPVVSTEGEKP